VASLDKALRNAASALRRAEAGLEGSLSR